MWVDWAALLIAPTLTAEILQTRAYALARQSGMSRRNARLLIFGEEMESTPRRYGARHARRCSKLQDPGYKRRRKARVALKAARNHKAGRPRVSADPPACRPRADGAPHA